MAISKTEFKQAFREIVSAEFSYVPTVEESIDFSFSKRFTSKMEKLIRAQKKTYWMCINTATKRVAIIFIVFFTLLTSVCTVKAIREPIVSFFTDVYNTYIRYIFEGDTVKEISREYSLKYVPSDFHLVDSTQNTSMLLSVYENEKGDVIEFTQSITDGLENTFDNENGRVFSLDVSGIDVKVLEIKNVREAIWIQDEYLLSIVTIGDIDIQILTEMIMSVE